MRGVSARTIACATFFGGVGTGRSRRIIIPVRTRFRSIEYVADARLEKTSPSTDVLRRSYQKRLSI